MTLKIDKNINAVIIATPVSTHFHMAKAALNETTLVEKPLASTSEECKILIDLADKTNLSYKLIIFSHINK